MTADTLFDQAFAAHRQGDLEAAGKLYDDAIAVEPNHARALHMRGVVHLQQRQPEQAVALIRQSIAIDPTDASAYGNFTSALLTAKRVDEAVEAGRTGVRLKPDAADIWANLGTALTRRDSYPDALEAFQRAAALQPERAGLHSAIGTCLGRLERYEEALISHRRAITLAPDRPEYRNNLSATLRKMELFADAEAELRAAIAGGADDSDLKASLGGLLYRRGKTAEAVAAFEQASRQHGPSGLDRSLTFFKNYVAENSIEAQLAQAERAAGEIAREVKVYTSHDNTPDPNRRIRLGLISSDFRQHAVGLFLMNTLKALDPSAVELFAYSGYDTKDDFATAFRAIIPNWRSTHGWSDGDLADRVRADGIDILVDLAGPTSGGRLGVFARKPAPVSFGWLGYSGSTGLDRIDYVLGDAQVLPAGVKQLAEQPWLMPDAYLCFSPQAGAPEVMPTPALANGSVTFGSLNNTNKISAATLDTWARVLMAVPGSRLQLKARAKDSSGEDKRQLAEEFSRRGIELERIEVLDWAPGWLQHLPLYHRVDIALDPFPYNGTTTTCEALHMGVPVLALQGDRFISRVTASILHTAGFDDWIADDLDTYVEKAAKFASDIALLEHVRQKVRPQFMASPMCDAPRFARNFESALRQMWRRWCESRR
jgi:predicted O-linked N-acetylglucosamine transferase (SPINDLY family)